MDDRTLNPGPWMDAESCPPETKPGSWSREVIGFSNLGNIFRVRYYYNGQDAGPWQRVGEWQRSTFHTNGEVIKWWIDKPDGE